MELNCEGLIERVARAICKSGKFETGEGTCAFRCMDQLGQARRDCPYILVVHEDLATTITKVIISD